MINMTPFPGLLRPESLVGTYRKLEFGCYLGVFSLGSLDLVLYLTAKNRVQAIG